MASVCSRRVRKVGGGSAQADGLHPAQVQQALTGSRRSTIRASVRHAHRNRGYLPRSQCARHVARGADRCGGGAVLKRKRCRRCRGSSRRSSWQVRHARAHAAPRGGRGTTTGRELDGRHWLCCAAGEIGKGETSRWWTDSSRLSLRIRAMTSCARMHR